MKNERVKWQAKKKPGSLDSQPQAITGATVPCPICGAPVNPRRMQPHMVRFHQARHEARGKARDIFQLGWWSLSLLGEDGSVAMAVCYMV